MANEIAPVLTIIFQASLEQGSLSTIWKTAAVVPTFKKRKKSDTCNYRPISLTCICSKILERSYSLLYQSILKSSWGSM